MPPGTLNSTSRRQPGAWIMRASTLVAGTCLALIVVITTLQVVCRYAFGAPLRWPEEMSRVLFIWMTYGGCLLLPQLRQHISIEFVYYRLPQRGRDVLDFTIDALGAVFFAFLTLSGIMVVQVMWGLRLPALRWPTNIVFGFVMLAAAAQTYLHLEAIALRLLRRTQPEAPPSEKFRF